MVIGLCGAGGTGKGTLMKALQEHGGYPFFVLPSPVEETGKRIAPDSKSYSDMLNSQKVILQYSALIAQMHSERVATMNGQHSISERSVLDFLPYMQEFLESCPAKDTTWLYEYGFYERMVKQYLSNGIYDVLIYVPIEFEPSAQDLKTNSWKEREGKRRRQTDRKIQELLKWVEENTQIKIVRVCGSVSERLKQVQEVISMAG